ncbi:hypothetical protein SUNI508_10731 [Seiridium unicorne]|uniref:Inner kinetochore subunit AME1 domain-containing protein n=1 Tax=Seiridium unicorne TaxID=138068 RepID=A0ABR2UK90_9PEZI
MATSRGERMQERMRGAGRHEVADESFGFILPAEEAPEEPEELEEPEGPAAAPTPIQTAGPAPVARSNPNTSAKRRRLGKESAPVSTQPSPQRPAESHRPGSASRADPYDIAQDEVREEGEEEESATVSSGRRHEAAPAPGGIGEEDGVYSSSKLVARPTSPGSISSRLSAGPHMTEEVTESPVGAPGSGHRRRVRMSDVTTQSAELQRMVMDQEASITEDLAASSPLVRKMRMSGVTASALSTRSRRTTGRSTLAQSVVDADELSPIPRPPRRSNSTIGSGSARSSLSAAQRSALSIVDGEPDELSSPLPLVESRRRAQAVAKAKKLKQTAPHPEVREVEEEENSIARSGSEEAHEGEAEQIEVEEAARVIGRKRPQPSPPRGESPELDAPREEPIRPLKKQRQKRAQGSPAIQAQPKAVSKKSGGPEKQQKRKRHSGEDEQIHITVQRYTQRQHYNESDTDGDILGAEIPFANRSGVNVIDVLAQMCEEVIDANLATLHEAAINADNPSTKKEYRIKLRALEAFQEELRTRLLEHTIALDTLHALKKRVRSVQKEKLALRNEILRIRAEREQVALKMDAVRIRHEKENKQSLNQLNLSTAMHHIDLAVENGRQASELAPKEQKAAELANLEWLVSRVAGQVTTVGGSGNLKQIREFNALLERAAAALEAR